MSWNDAYACLFWEHFYVEFKTDSCVKVRCMVLSLCDIQDSCNGLVVCQRGGRIDTAPLQLRSLLWLPLATGETPHHLEDRGADPQGAVTVLTTSTPPYLHDMRPSQRRSTDGAHLLFVPRVRTDFARRAFSISGPTVFNLLAANIRLSHSTDIFNRHLKTHLFRTP